METVWSYFSWILELANKKSIIWILENSSCRRNPLTSASVYLPVATKSAGLTVVEAHQGKPTDAESVTLEKHVTRADIACAPTLA